MEEQVDFDKQDQLELIQAQLVPQEALHAVYDCYDVATGFVGITDKRLILYVPRFLAVRAKALVSVPYHHISSVGCVEPGLMAPAKILIHTTAGEQHEMSFRPEEKGRKAYTLIMTHVLDMPE